MLLTFTALTLSACAKHDYEFAGKTYIYEKLVSDGVFTITINEDGTFTYREGEKSDYIAKGTWSYRKGILTLDDELSRKYNFVNKFVVLDGNLVFVEEDSTNFPSVTVKDGEKFFDISAN